MKTVHTIEEAKKLIMDKLSQINDGNDYEMKDILIERILDNVRLHHVYADNSTFNVWFKITNKNNEQSIIEFKYALSYRVYKLKDINIVFPFAKRNISTIENTTNHLLITTENGSGIYNLNKKRYDLEIGKIAGINEIKRVYFCNQLGFCMTNIDAFLISNSEQKKELYVPGYEELCIQREYDEIYEADDLISEIFHTRNMGTIYKVKKGDKLGLYIYRYFPVDETVLYCRDYEIDDDGAYYNKMSITILQANYDQIESIGLLRGSGILKIVENCKEGLYDVNCNEIIVPPTFDKIEIVSRQNKNIFKAKIGNEQYLISSKYGDGAPYIIYKVTETPFIEKREPQKTRKLVNIGKKLPRYPDEEHRY